MKKTILPLIVALTSPFGAAYAAPLNVPLAGLTIDFATAPVGGDFYSVNVLPSNSGAIAILGTAATGMDNPTTGVSHLLALPTTNTDWVTNSFTVPATAAQVTNLNVRYATNTTGFNAKMLTGPTGNTFTALIGAFVNGSGTTRRNFEVKFDAGTYFAAAGTGAAVPPAATGDPLAGLHLYASPTGAIDTWQRIGGPYLTGTITNTVTFGTVIPNAAPFYIAFIDDNGPGSGTTPNFEGNYTVDNIVITPKDDTIAPVITGLTRVDSSTPRNAMDDTVSFTLKVTATDPTATMWVINKVGSALNGLTGTYGNPVSVTAIPIAEFAPGNTFTVTDQTVPTVTATATATAPACVITATHNNMVLADNSTPVDFTDDLVSYNVSVDGTWTNANYKLDQPAATALYGSNTAVTAVSPNSPHIHNFEDAIDANCKAQLIVNPIRGIGINETGASPVAIFAKESTGNRYYTTAPSTAVTTHVSGVTAAADYVLESGIIDLSAVNGAIFTMELDALPQTGASTSGFEAADYISLQLIIDGGAPVSILGAYDLGATPDGKLSGAAGAGTELPGANAPITDIRNYTFSYPILAAANSVQFRATINTNSLGETLILKNIKLSSDGPRISAARGAVSRDNKGTVTPTDDVLVAPVTVTATNGAGVTGWTSDLVLPEAPQTGNYAVLTNFTVAAPKTVNLSDVAGTATTSFTIAAPAQTLTATLVPASIVRNADDSVSFSLNIVGNNVGPQFVLTSLAPFAITGSGAYPVAPATAPVTIRGLPRTASTFNIQVHDASYPLAPNPVNVAIAIPAPTTPTPASLGQKNLGTGLSELAIAASGTEWVNFPLVRKSVMITGGTNDSVVESESLNLANVGSVNFTAKLRARDNSQGSNLETTDRFKAELDIDGTIISLITAYDTGAGGAAVGSPGTAGNPSGFINGYNDVAGADFLTGTVYALAADNYNANKSRDEFNIDLVTAAASMDSVLPLSYTIPAEANNVKFKFYGAGVSGSEAFVVEDVLFAAAPVISNGDTDGDGVSDANEVIMGTSPTDASDVTRLAPTATPGQYSIVGKAGRFYRIYASDDTDEPTHLTKWLDSSIGFSGAGTHTADVTVIPTEARRFIRIHVKTTDGPWPAVTP